MLEKNKQPPNLAVYNKKKFMLSYGFRRSGVWEQLSWETLAHLKT